MNKLNLIWIIALFLLVLPMAFAAEQEDWFNSAFLIVSPTVNCTLETSSLGALGSENSDPAFIDTANSYCSYDGNDAVVFAGRSEYNTVNRTFCAWVNFSATGAQNAFAGTHSAVSSNGDWSAYFHDGDQTFTAKVHPGATGLLVTYVNSSIRDGIKYAQQCFTVNQTSTSLSTMVLYIDGAEVGVATRASTQPAPNDNIWVGELFETIFFTGDMKGLVVTNDAKSSDEIKWLYDQGEDFDLVAEPSVDTEPVAITLINLSSEGGTGQIIYNLSSGVDTKLTNFARTNDTTPTIRATTNASATCAILEHGFNLNYTDAIAYNPSAECTTTGTTEQICTLTSDNSTNRTGIHLFSIGCKDTSANANENITSTSGLFRINITDPVAPNITLYIPESDALFVIGVNNTNINFTFSGVDNIDPNWTIKFYIDNVLKITNTSFLNHTNTSYFFDEIGIGTHTWYVNSTDSYNNKNQSEIRSFEVQQQETVDLFLDGLSDSRKYEFRTKANISANCTQNLGVTCQVCIDLDAPDFGFNYSCGFNKTHFIFNITILRIENFSDGRGIHTLNNPGIINITSDNRTIIDRVVFNVTSSKDTTNLNISYYGQSLEFKGNLTTKYLVLNEFLHSGIYKDAVNLTHLSAGSSFIYSDLTDINNPINMTFQLTGFDLDANNEFSYTEHFNGTVGAIEFNESLSYHADAPLGVFDDFITNVSGRWGWIDAGSVSCSSNSFSYVSETLIGSVSSTGTSQHNCNFYSDYTDVVADIRNTSRIELLFNQYAHRNQPINADCTAGASTSTYITDGTSIVLLKSYPASGSGASSTTVTGVRNFTLIKKSDDYKTWELLINGSSEGNKGLSSLDFTKQIKIRQVVVSNVDGEGMGPSCSSSASVRRYSIKWGGAWLNMSSNNGTYKSTGNITQCLVETTDNIAKVTLIATEYKPTNTQIDYLVSNDGGINPTFESITPGITHTFATTGKDLCWRATLNSSENITSPVIRKVEIDITPTSVENVTVALDGTDIFTFTGRLNSTTSPTFVNLSPTANQLNTIKISSVTAGLIQVDNFKLNSSINPISLNASFFESCQNCSINFTFSGDSITIEELEFDFLGSWNYTAIARYKDLKVNFTTLIYYSNFNLSIPSGYEWWDVFPSSKDSKNITPYTQSATTPIWNLSNQAYDEPIDIYVKTNKTLSSCLNITFSNNTNRIESIVNESFTAYNGTAIRLATSNLVGNSEVVFNQSGGTTIGSNNYSIDYADGTITFNSSIISNATIINESINIELMKGNINSSILAYYPVNSESVRNATNPFALLNPDIDYRMDYSKKNFTLINETFNNTNLYITYNYTNSTLLFYGMQFGINYSYYSYGFDYNNDFTFKLNTSYQKIVENISVNLLAYPNKGIWNWVNLANCISRFEIPWFYFASTCTDCYFNEPQLDNYNIIET